MSISALSLDVQVLTQAKLWAEYQPVWLCTVLRTWGSSPRSPGALLVAAADGAHCGSLSGGCVEESFLRQIARGKWREASQVVRYGDGGLEPDMRLPCGGVLEILVEYLPPGAQTVTYLNALLDGFIGHHALLKQLTLPDACHTLSPVAFSARGGVECHFPDIAIRIAASPCLLVAGYSPVAHYCMQFAVSLGFEVILCEPRAEMRQQAEALDAIQIVDAFPAHYLEQQGCHNRTAIVALTHDARMDDLTLMEAVNTPAFYIGAMGSALNSARRLERLKRIAELTDTDLAKIHAPIGLNIGSKTPAEIALSVMADIISHKNNAEAESTSLNAPIFKPDSVAEAFPACAARG